MCGRRMEVTSTNSRLRKKKEPDLAVPIKNITICDAKTGFVILECIYQWPEQAVTTNLGSLILSFYQFAREVDDGEIVSVNFEKFAKQRSRTGTLNVKNVPLDTMKMVCKKNSLFVVSIYYDMRGGQSIPPEDIDKLSRLLQMIEIEFQMKYGGTYLEQQPIIATLDSTHETQAREVREYFSPFRSTIHSMTQSCFLGEVES